MLTNTSFCPHHLEMKIRRDDRLSNLDAASRAKLDNWLKHHTYREVVQLAGAPPPTGLGLTTNIRALSAYYKKWLAPTPLSRLIDLAAENPQAAQTAATALLQAQTLQAASNPEIDLGTLTVLVRFHGQTIRNQARRRPTQPA
jgi:hypothetical protein